MKTNSNQIKILILLVLSVISNAQAQNCNNNELIINQDFSKYTNQNKEYTLNMLKSDFPRVSARTSGEIRGVGGNWPQETRVINGELRAEYTKNAASGRKGGFLFDSSFNGLEEATLEYRLKFDKNFTWATGGKLPGLGGSATSNGGIPAGCTMNQNVVKNAFSCRLMWRSNRAHTQKPYIIVYPYLPNRETRCGGNIRIINDIKKDKWYTIKQYLKLNTPGKKNGILKMYVDGKLLVNLTDVEYRLPGKGNVKINSLIMHTYRGGNATDPVWWSPNTDYAYFDTIKVWTNCSGNGGGNNQPPSVSFATPTGNTSVLNGYNDFNVTVNATDPDGNISNVKLYVDNSLVREEKVAPYEWGKGENANELLGLSLGEHTIKAEATDNDGTKTSKTFILTVKSNTPNQSPSLSFITPSGNISVEEGYNLTINVKASDTDGTIKNVKLYRDNTLVRQENVTPYEWGHANSPNPNELNNLSAGNYTFKAVASDNDGNTSEKSFILTVKQKNNDGGVSDCSFGAPVNNGLSAMDKVTYANVHIIGNDGPNLSNFRKFTINWVPQNNGLYQFAINTNNGSPNWYVDFKDAMSFQLKNAKPEVTLNNTGFSGLDGSYWVVRDGNNFAMVSKNRNFTVYFSNSASEPNCNRAKLEKDLPQIMGYPNPISGSLFTVSGMSPESKTLQIVSLEGRVVKEIDTENATETLEVSELPSGSYFLLVKGIRLKKSIFFIKK